MTDNEEPIILYDYDLTVDTLVSKTVSLERRAVNEYSLTVGDKSLRVKAEIRWFIVPHIKLDITLE